MPEFLDKSDFLTFKYEVMGKFDDIERKVNMTDREVISLKNFFIRKLNLFVLIFSILFTFMLTLQIILILYQNIGNNHIIKKIENIELIISHENYYIPPEKKSR